MAADARPGPSRIPNPEPAAADEAAETPDALSEEFPGDSWSRPAGQARRAARPHRGRSPRAQLEQPQQPPVPPQQNQPRPPTPSWTQPAAESTGSWTQPAPEKPDFEDDAAADSGDRGQPVTAATPHRSTSRTSPAHDSGPAGVPETPVFGGQSFSVSNQGFTQPPAAAARPAKARARAATPRSREPQGQQSGQPLSPGRPALLPAGHPRPERPAAERDGLLPRRRADAGAAAAAGSPGRARRPQRPATAPRHYRARSSESRARLRRPRSGGR